MESTTPIPSHRPIGFQVSSMRSGVYREPKTPTPMNASTKALFDAILQLRNSAPPPVTAVPSNSVFTRHVSSPASSSVAKFAVKFPKPEPQSPPILITSSPIRGPSPSLDAMALPAPMLRATVPVQAPAPAVTPSVLSRGPKQPLKKRFMWKDNSEASLPQLRENLASPSRSRSRTSSPAPRVAPLVKHAPKLAICGTVTLEVGTAAFRDRMAEIRKTMPERYRDKLDLSTGKIGRTAVAHWDVEPVRYVKKCSTCRKYKMPCLVASSTKSGTACRFCVLKKEGCSHKSASKAPTIAMPTSAPIKDPLNPIASTTTSARLPTKPNPLKRKAATTSSDPTSLPPAKKGRTSTASASRQRVVSSSSTSRDLDPDRTLIDPEQFLDPSSGEGEAAGAESDSGDSMELSEDDLLQLPTPRLQFKPFFGLDLGAIPGKLGEMGTVLDSLLDQLDTGTHQRLGTTIGKSKGSGKARKTEARGEPKRSLSSPSLWGWHDDFVKFRGTFMAGSG